MPAGDDAIQKELQDIEVKLRSAREAAAAPGATEREKSDLKLIEQEYLAAQQQARHASSKPDKPPSDLSKKMDKELDDALKDTFPGSDPVSFIEATPVKEQDRSLTAVKVSDQQAAEGKERKRAK